MSTPTDDDRDDALLRRLYEEPDADGADGELAREVAGYRRIRGAIADYARATEVEPPSRGLDELMAAARSRVPARAAVAAEEPPGLWARLRAWLQPIIAHPALASAAMVVVVAGIAGVLYVKGKANLAEPEAERAPAVAYEERTVAVGSGAMARDRTADDAGVVARLDDGSATTTPPPVNQIAAPGIDDANADTNPERGPAHRPKAGKLGADKGKKEAELSFGSGRGTGTGSGAGGAGATTDSRIEPGAGGDSVAVGTGTITTEGNLSKGPPAEPVIQTQTQPAPPPVAPTQDNRRSQKKPSGAAGGEKAPTVDESGATEAPDVAESSPEPGAKDGKAPTQKPRTDVGQLTRQARTAARGGDCAVVKALGGRVRAASASYYKQTFATDPDIKKCL